jgi:hypothetical protein
MRKLLTTLLLWLPLAMFGQTIVIDGPPRIPLGTSGGGGGGGTWTGVASQSVQGATGADTVAGPYDTTGANLIVEFVTYSGGTAPSTIANTGDTFLTATNDGLDVTGNPKMFCRYITNPTSTTTYYITNTAVGGDGPNVSVNVVNKSGGSPVYVTSTDANRADLSGNVSHDWRSTKTFAGSLASASGDALFTGVAWDVATQDPFVDSGFTDPNTTAFHTFGLNAGYLFPSSSATINVSWQGDPSINCDAWCMDVKFQ